MKYLGNILGEIIVKKYASQKSAVIRVLNIWRKFCHYIKIAQSEQEKCSIEKWWATKWDISGGIVTKVYL